VRRLGEIPEYKAELDALAADARRVMQEMGIVE
jgi:hypothetical protein